MTYKDHILIAVILTVAILSIFYILHYKNNSICKNCNKNIECDKVKSKK